MYFPILYALRTRDVPVLRVYFILFFHKRVKWIIRYVRDAKQATEMNFSNRISVSNYAWNIIYARLKIYFARVYIHTHGSSKKPFRFVFISRETQYRVFLHVSTNTSIFGLCPFRRFSLNVWPGWYHHHRVCWRNYIVCTKKRARGAHSDGTCEARAVDDGASRKRRWWLMLEKSITGTRMDGAFVTYIFICGVRECIRPSSELQNGVPWFSCVCTHTHRHTLISQFCAVLFLITMF